MASESFARLISLRSGLPLHPENPEIVSDLGGREGVERLLGSLDDLLVHCADAFVPIGALYSAFHKLKCRTEEIIFSYRKGLTLILPCSSQLMHKLKVCFLKFSLSHVFYFFSTAFLFKASRQRIASLASECVKQWFRFSETCLSHSKSQSKNIDSLLEANVEFLSLKTPCDLPKVFNDFRTRLEEIASRLDQRIPQPCIAITDDVISQQKLLETAVGDFLQCCRMINSQMPMDTTLVSGLFSVAEAISAEVKISNVSVTSFENKVNSLIIDILICFQDFKRFDEIVEVERGMIDQLIGSVSALSSTGAVKLDGLIVTLGRLTPSSTEDILYLQSLTPLLLSFLNGVGLRLRHLLSLLISWLCLGEYLAQVTFRLLNDGFCKPAALSKAAAETEACGNEGSSTGDTGIGNSNNEHGDDGGCTSLNTEGADATGAKDVSKELQSQEQIEGTINQNYSQNDQNKSPPDPNDEGIEMPDDFEGILDDGDGREEENSEKDGNKGENDLQGIDEQMGEVGDDPDELNQEMWASDDDDNEGDDKNEQDRKSVELNETGIEDCGNNKSKTSKSTAVNEKLQKSDVKSGLGTEDIEDVEGGGEADDINDVTTNTNSDKSTPAKASESKTVACEEENNERMEGKANVLEEIKQDEQRLAQGAAEMMETEEKEEGKEDTIAEEFGENIEPQPNFDEFEDMDGEIQCLLSLVFDPFIDNYFNS